MPTQPHTQANEDSIEGTPTTGAVTDFTGRLNALFSMYNEQAEIQDRKMVERLKGEADGMLHASSLFSIIVSILLGMSYQTFSQAASQVNLAQICHLNTCQKNPLIRLPSDPSDPSAVIHSPTASAIWVNALWSLCLVISLSCFLFASLLQHWIRRYLHIVQMPRSPQRRVRIRELMTQGIDKHYLLWVAAALPSLFHISVFLFLAGLLVSLSSTMPAVFMVISAGVGVCALLYLAFSLSPILHYDSPFYTPLSSLIWSTIVGIPWLILNLIYRVTERLNFIGYRTRFRVLDLARTFHQLTFMGMMKAVEDLASTRVLELDTPALLRTFDSLEGDQDMEKFLVGLPGFYSSTEVEKDAQALEHLHSHQLPSAIVAFMDRSWSSNVLSEDDKRRRIKICLDVMNMDPLFLQCTFRQTLLSTGSSLFECADFVIGAESHYGNPDLWTRHYAQCIVAVAISRVQEFSGSWQDIAQRQQDSFQVPLKKASWNADSMKLINFIWIAWILKASYLTSSDQFEPDRMWHNVLSETLKFNASGTSSELWEHFCNLWNSLVAVTKDSPGYLMARANAGSFLSLLSATHPLFHPGAALTVAAPYSQCHIDTHQLPTSHLVEKVSDTEATHPRPRSTSPTLVRSPEDDARPYDVESPTLDTVRLPLSDAEATLKNPNPQEETIQKPSYAEDTLQSRGFLSQILTGTIGPHQPSRPMMLGERVPQGLSSDDGRPAISHALEPGIPGPDAHAPITGSPVLPAAPHDEPQEHTHNAEEPVQVLTDCVSEQYAGPSVPIQKSPLIGLSPALREIKRQLEQFAEGKLQRLSHLDQREPPSVISLRRSGVRILMSCASFSSGDFASPIGYIGPPETTLYYPTGNPQRDMVIAFTVALDCIDDLEAHTRGNDTRLASKLSELAQALSDLGLHTHALAISYFASEIIESLTSDNSCLDLASILSLQANILCDLKRNDKSIDTAERAVTLCKRHRDSLNGPIPEVAYALLNLALLLCSFGLKDEGAAVAFELQGEVDGNSQPDMKHISALCGLCLSITRIEADDELALSIIEESIELSRGSSDADWQTTLASALLIKSKILSSMGLDEAACPISAEAITLLRTLRIKRPLFSLFLADALDTHAYYLSEANRKGESFLTSQDAVDLWQTLKVSAPGPILGRLAWALFSLAKFRKKDADRVELNKELEIAETAVTVFRDVSPLDAPGLGDALYIYADRMLELDKNQEAATYAEESVQYFREACSDELGKEKYRLDLVFSLSLASACLACTDRADDAFEYAKQAVQVQHERTGTTNYKAHLGKLLLDVVFRATEMNKQEMALPWFQELESLGGPEVMAETDEPTVRRSDCKPQPQVHGPEFKKEANCWIYPLSGADNGKEVAPPAEASGFMPRVDNGKGREVNPAFDLSGFGRPGADKEIFSPGAKAAQRGLQDLGKAEPLLGSLLGGSGGNDTLGSLLGGTGDLGVGDRNQGGLNMGGPALHQRKRRLTI